jgi:hypothetical protein
MAGNNMESVAAKPHLSLPPLILHPFADAAGPSKLVESSRASLMLQGLLPTGDLTPQQLESRLLDGRFCEIRMLFYVGKDLVRWVEQCLEQIERQPELEGRGFNGQTFVAYLLLKTPPSVQEKLRKWGVADYKAIFSRAIALNEIFAAIPDRRVLTDEFVRNYYRYTDVIFRLMIESVPEIETVEFDFELFASGEYSRMLEREWGGEPAAEA